MGRMTFVSLYIAGCLLLAPLCSWAERVSIQEGRISVDLQDADVLSVAKDIERQTGITFKGDESLLEEKISVSFKDLPLEQGIKRILTNLNYSLVFDSRGEVSEVKLMSEGTSASASPSQVRQPPTRTVPPASERRPVIRRPRPSSPLVTGGRTPPPSRTRTRPQRVPQAVSPGAETPDVSNVPEAFRAPGGDDAQDGPLRVIERPEIPEAPAKSSRETPQAATGKQKGSPPAEESPAEKPEEESAAKEEPPAKNQKP